jgi:hypothetical protein
MLMRVALRLHDALPHVIPKTNQMLVLFRIPHGLRWCHSPSLHTYTIQSGNSSRGTVPLELARDLTASTELD